MAIQFNKLAVRKELGALAYRLADTHLEHGIKVGIIRRHLENLWADLPDSFNKVITAARAALDNNDFEELVEAIALIRRMLPPTTYGELPAGTEFRVPGGEMIATKRKWGIEIGRARLSHLDANQIIIPV